MLNFRNTSIAFLLILCGLAGYDYGHELSLWSYVSVAFLFSIAIFFGSYFIQSGFFLKAHCSGDRGKPSIAISFDDGPHENTLRILDVLKSNRATAAFFCIGKRMTGNEKIIARIAEEGHLVSNHSFSHHNLYDFYSAAKLERDAAETDELIFRITGRRNKLFRPPFGVTTPNIARMVKARNYKVVGWNLRSYDTTIRDRQKLMKRIRSRIKNGSVILLHDTTPGIEVILQEVLDHARRQNLNVVGIDEMFQIKAYEIN